MLQLKCDRCRRELDEPGALLFGPPRDQGWLVEKRHLCVECYAVIVQQLSSATQAARQAPDAAGSEGDPSGKLLRPAQ